MALIPPVEPLDDDVALRARALSVHIPIEELSAGAREAMKVMDARAVERVTRISEAVRAAYPSSPAASEITRS